MSRPMFLIVKQAFKTMALAAYVNLNKKCYIFFDQYLAIVHSCSTFIHKTQVVYSRNGCNAKTCRREY